MTSVSDTPTVSTSSPWRWSLDSAAESIVLRLAGSWRLQDHLPSPGAVETELTSAASARRLGFDTREVIAWDSGLLVFVLNVLDAATSLGLTVDRSGLPDGVRKLLDLAAAVPERDTKRAGASPSLLARVGASALSALAGAREMITFVGEAALAFAHATVGRARFRRVDLLLTFRRRGARAPHRDAHQLPRRR